MNEHLEAPAEFDATEQEDASALKWLIEMESFDEND
jgi:hypothetical protein